MVEQEPILELREITKRFGALEVLKTINLTVAAGERRAIIGPNGAGKTTLFNVISGTLRPTAGDVVYRGRSITGLSPDSIARLGLARTFQKNTLFLNLSAEQNVCLALQQRDGIAHGAFRSIASYVQVRDGIAEILSTIGLTEQAPRLVRELSYGEQRQLELALALAQKPAILLLDEPTAGMSPAETTRMIEIVRRLPREVTIVIIEHDMDVVFAIADAITVLDYGVVLADGKPAEIQENPAVQEAYLGVSMDSDVVEHA